MGRKQKQRRQQHGSAWHWKQTDCWYYTLPGTKKRTPLFDENGESLGKTNVNLVTLLHLMEVGNVFADLQGLLLAVFAFPAAAPNTLRIFQGAWLSLRFRQVCRDQCSCP